MLISALVVSAQETVPDAVVTFTLPATDPPTPIVKGVPFDLDVNMDSQGKPLMKIQLYVTPEPLGSAAFAWSDSTSRSGTVWLPSNTLKNKELLPNGNWWFNLVTTTGPSGILTDFTTTGYLKKVFSLRTTIENTATVTLTSADNLAVLGSNVGTLLYGSSLHVAPTPIVIEPVNSVCGDGVVGYVDPEGTGIITGKKPEACDEGKNADGTNKNGNPGGCSANCEYVEIDWQCSRTNSGDRLSSCTRMDPVTIAVRRFESLLRNTCYPNKDHPERKYCTDRDKDIQVTFEKDASGKETLTLSSGDRYTKSEKIGLIAGIIRVFFSS